VAFFLLFLLSVNKLINDFFFPLSFSHCIISHNKGMILSPRDYSNSLCSAANCQSKLTITSHMVKTIHFKLVANCVLFIIASTVHILDFANAFLASSTSRWVLQSLISKGLF
jgi:hypothetical protein